MISTPNNRGLDDTQLGCNPHPISALILHHRPDRQRPHRHPLQPEIELLNRLLGPGTWMASLWPQMASWIGFVHQGILQTAKDFPFLQYGTDWLALGHIVIAIAFIGPPRDPVHNVWVVELGMIACVLVTPVALGLGEVRQIPFFGRLIDSSFGVFGIVPLWIVRRDIRRLESGIALQLESGR